MQRPDDGYIVDSLGWANYRLGQYDEAVKQLERAVTLKPSDPTINDHLGDAYWKSGRKLEATFQWKHARDAKPEPERWPSSKEDQAGHEGRPLLTPPSQPHTHARGGCTQAHRAAQTCRRGAGARQCAPARGPPKPADPLKPTDAPKPGDAPKPAVPAAAGEVPRGGACV